MSDQFAHEAFALARFVLRLTFVILTAAGLAVSILLIALAYTLERLYAVPALPWAFATLTLPACGLLVLAFSTRLATFVTGSEAPVGNSARRSAQREAVADARESGSWS